MKNLLFSALFSLAVTPVFSQITGYQRFFATARQPGQKETLVVLRKWQRRGVEEMLVVHPSSLLTEVLPVKNMSVHVDSWQNIWNSLNQTPYIKALAEAYRTDSLMQDAGLTTANRHKKGIDLTVDLCPSKRPLDRNFFNKVVKLMNPEEKPVPVAIAITGLWMIEHPADLDWLKHQMESGILKITWIDHSFHHRFEPGKPLTKNFMLEPGTSVENEVLETEKMMIANGLTPSVFFRFPGEVSDKIVFDKVADYGLIGIGSDAWLAKGQHPENGSVVLVHANGNDPLGEDLFVETLKNNREQILRGQWLLYDLPKSVDTTEKQ